LLRDEAPRAAIFSGVVDELQNPTPTLLVIEDVHRADEATLDLLKFLGRRINKLNSLLVITYRDDEMRAEHPLRFVLGDLLRPSVRRLRLPALSEDALDELAVRAGKHRRSLCRYWCNPFFVTEALASHDPAVPVSVSDAMLSRLARLTPAAHAVVELVSVVPMPPPCFAALQAAALHAHRESALHYQTALKYAGALAPEQRADLFERRSYECYVRGQISDAWEARRQALEIWQQLGNKLRQGDNVC